VLRPPGLIIERRLPRDLDHHGGALTWSLRCADETRCVPTPLTLTRRKVRCTPVVPGFAATPLSTASWVLVPKLVVGRSDWT